MALVIAATIAALASVLVAYIQVKDRSKFKEIHRETTVNHHSSSAPTIKDMLDDIKATQKETRDLIVRHIEWHYQKDTEA